MKKSKSVVAFSLCLFSLCSCVDPNIEPGSEPTSSEEIVTPSSSLPEPSPAKEYQAKDVYDALMRLANSKSYTATYQVTDDAGNVTTYHDVMTENYIYYATNGQGYVGLESYDKAQFADKIVYSFTLNEEGKVAIGGIAQTYNQYNALIPVESINEVRFMNYFTQNGFKIHEDLFTETEENVFESTDARVAYVLARSFNMYAYYYYGYIRSVRFVFNEEEDLVISLMGRSAQTGLPLSIMDFTMEDVDTSHLETVESAFGDYSLPKVTLGKDALNALKGDLGLSTKIYQRKGLEVKDLDTAEGQTLLYTAELDYSADYLRKNVLTATGETALLTQYSETEGITYLNGINGKNEEIALGTGEKISKMDRFANFDYAPFRALEEGATSYYYYGLKQAALGNLLAGFDLSLLNMGSVRSLQITVENGAIKGFEAAMDVMMDRANNLYRIHVISTVRPFSKETGKINPYEEGDEDLKNALAKYDGSQSFMIRLSEGSYYTEIPETRTDLTYDKDKKIVYIEDYDNTVLMKRYGYFLRETGIVPFEVKDGKVIERNVPDTRNNFKNLFGLGLDYRVLEVKEIDEDRNKKTYIPKQEVVDLKGSLYLGTNDASKSMIVQSFSLMTNDAGEVEKYSYQYGTKTVNFEPKLLTEVALPEDLDFEHPTEYVAPTSWKEENATIDTKLSALLGKKASLVPYLFERELTGQYSVIAKNGTVRIYSFAETDQFGNHFNRLGFMTKYEEILAKAGWTKGEPNEKGQAVYTKEGVQIALGKTIFEGVIVSLIA